MIVPGPSSPPITSMAIRIQYQLPVTSCRSPVRIANPVQLEAENWKLETEIMLLRSDGPGGPCNNRSAGRSGAGPSIHDTEGTFPRGQDSRHRACAAWPFASWNGGVWDSARLVLLLSIQQFFQRCQPGIDPFGLAPAVGAIQVRTALGAQATARFRAQRLHGQRELKLLAQHLDDVQRALPVKGGRQIVFTDLAFLFGRVRLRHVAKLEASVHRHLEVIQAASALELKPGDRPARDSKDPGGRFLDVHRELDRNRHAVVLVLRLKGRRRERPFEVFALAVKLAEIKEHGL